METSELVIRAYDCEPAKQRSYLATSDEQVVDFILHNPAQHTLVFAAIDNCILHSADESRCDFVLGNFQRLYLVEVKRAKLGQRGPARDSAVVQLAATLTLLRTRIALQQTELVAVMSLKARQTHPVQSARKGADRLRFFDDYHADLVEGQEANFSH